MSKNVLKFETPLVEGIIRKRKSHFIEVKTPLISLQVEMEELDLC